jgi:hypothetical protein
MISREGALRISEKARILAKFGPARIVGNAGKICVNDAVCLNAGVPGG